MYSTLQRLVLRPQNFKPVTKHITNAMNSNVLKHPGCPYKTPRQSSGSISSTNHSGAGTSPLVTSGMAAHFSGFCDLSEFDPEFWSAISAPDLFAPALKGYEAGPQIENRNCRELQV